VISCAHAPGYFLTFISFSLFDLSNRRFSKKLVFTSCSVLTDFCHYLCLPLDRFFFSSFDHGTFEKVSIVAYALMGVILEFKLNQNSRFTIVLTLMLLIELCEVLYEGSFQV
jgi:hypothetical protein